MRLTVLNLSEKSRFHYIFKKLFSSFYRCSGPFQALAKRNCGVSCRVFHRKIADKF